ncbi:MAG: aldo/keto reductase [Phycisphaerae bacterium]|nr:aldo/keto reductase [Phycisphaerae bacterium]
MPRRQYGKTDVKLSVIGFGGYLLNNMKQDDANRIVAESVERGVNYFDVAPTYGNAEERLGPALEPFRKDVFLACKTTHRKAADATKELEASLKQLRTDHVDLYQLHALRDVAKDVEAVFAKGGAMEAFLAAKKKGQVRFLGFSAHSEEAALAAMDRYDFDSVLFPVNFACYYKGDFGPRVVAKARAKGAAVLALKAMACRQYAKKDDPDRQRFPNCWYRPLSDRKEAEMGLRFALSQPITAAVSPADAGLFQLAVELATNVKPMTPDDEKALRALAQSGRPVFSRSNPEA